mgnify:CR=1 FL=1
MKTGFITAALIASAVLVSCKQAPKGGDTLKAQADSLYKAVLKGHDVAMSPSMKIPDLQKTAQHMVDSLAALKGKAAEEAAPLKAKLEQLVNELDYADNAMNKWMMEMNWDSASNDLEQRVKYLTEEKLKVDKVKEAVLGSIAKADSLLNPKH